MPTRADLIEAVAEDLGILPSEETLSAGDSTLIGRKYDEVLDELVGSGIATWSATIPAGVMPGLRKMVGFEVGPAFGQAISYDARVLGERMIRRQVVYRDNGEPVPAVYY